MLSLHQLHKEKQQNDIIMKKLFLTFAFVLFATVIMAQTTFSDGDFKYLITNMSSSTVSVAGITVKNPSELKIPNAVTYNGKAYKVTKIESYAFPKREEIYNLKKITIGDYVETIPSSCFYQYNLEEVILGAGVKTIEERAFMSCYHLNSITLPSGLTEIGNYAFMYSAISSITIPKGVTTIGQSVFANSSLKTIIFEGPITYIGSEALRSMGLLSVSLKNTIPPEVYYEVSKEFFANAFMADAYDKVYIHVPLGCRETYENDEFWGMFNKIVSDVPIWTCATPTITVKDGMFCFSCTTPGVTFHSKVEIVASDDNGEFTGPAVAVGTVGKKVSVYATKNGLADSETVTKIFAQNVSGVPADVNLDTKVNSADVVAVYNYIISGN